MRILALAMALLLIFTGAAAARPAAECDPPANLLAQNASARPDPNRPIHDKWALIIGISKFKDDSLNLKYPAKDARDLAKFLTEEANFAPDHIKLLVDEKASRENILDYMGDKWLPRVAAPDDLVLIFISSHGSPSALDLGGINYIVAHDTDKDRLYSTGLAMQDLARIIKGRVHSDRVLILLDACHSGAATPADSKGIVRTGNISAEEVAQGTGQMVICSSDTNEVSWESKRYENSVFTHCLIASLKKNGKQTKLSEAFAALKESVETEVRRDRGAQQVPILKGHWQGDELMVALAPAHPGPGLEIADENQVEGNSSTTSKNAAAAGTTVTIIPAGNASNEGRKDQSSPAIPQHAMVAVMRFGGPEEVECKSGSLFSAMRSRGFKTPREADFAGLPEALRQAIADKLKEKLGDSVFGPKELPNTTGAAYYTQPVNADYQIEGAIGKFKYDPGDLFGNKYEIEFSADLINCSTRKVLFSIQERQLSGFLKNSADPLTQIYTDITGKIADIIVEKTLSKLKK